jgi:hypothetical protein
MTMDIESKLVGTAIAVLVLIAAMLLALVTVQGFSSIRHDQVCVAIEGSPCVQCKDGIEEIVRCPAFDKGGK